MGVGSEEGDGRLRGGEQQAPLLHPGDDIRGMIGQGVRRRLWGGGEATATKSFAYEVVRGEESEK